MGWYGNGSLGSVGLTPIQVPEGETVNLNIDMIRVPAGALIASGGITR